MIQDDPAAVRNCFVVYDSEIMLYCLNWSNKKILRKIFIDKFSLKIFAVSNCFRNPLSLLTSFYTANYIDSVTSVITEVDVCMVWLTRQVIEYGKKHSTIESNWTTSCIHVQLDCDWKNMAQEMLVDRVFLVARKTMITTCIAWIEISQLLDSSNMITLPILSNICPNCVCIINWFLFNFFWISNLNFWSYKPLAAVPCWSGKTQRPNAIDGTSRKELDSYLRCQKWTPLSKESFDIANFQPMNVTLFVHVCSKLFFNLISYFVLLCNNPFCPRLYLGEIRLDPIQAWRVGQFDEVEWTDFELLFVACCDLFLLLLFSSHVWWYL